MDTLPSLDPPKAARVPIEQARIAEDNGKKRNPARDAAAYVIGAVMVTGQGIIAVFTRRKRPATASGTIKTMRCLRLAKEAIPLTRSLVGKGAPALRMGSAVAVLTDATASAAVDSLGHLLAFRRREIARGELAQRIFIVAGTALATSTTSALVLSATATTGPATQVVLVAVVVWIAGWIAGQVMRLLLRNWLSPRERRRLRAAELVPSRANDLQFA